MNSSILFKKYLKILITIYIFTLSIHFGISIILEFLKLFL